MGGSSDVNEPQVNVDHYRIVALLQRHRVHDLGYFGPGTFEQFPVLDTG
jgi:hypothetical protein